jgi:hypothetical protein
MEMSLNLELVGAFTPTRLDDLELGMLAEPQVECPVEHFIATGVYVRTCTMPADTLVLGHFWRAEQINVMLKGKIRVVVNGEVLTMAAPQMFVGPPGRKLAYVIEETVWQNIVATTETDVEAIEALIVDKAGERHTAQEAQEAQMLMGAAECQL